VLPGVLAIVDRRLHLLHRTFDAAAILFGREPLQALLGRQLDIDRTRSA
jgi:hypothetical protein